MQISSRLRPAARLLAVLCLAGPCAGAAAARSVDVAPPAGFASAHITLDPFDIRPAPQPMQQPFGLTVEGSGPMADKWRMLQPAIRMETKILALCRTDATVCPPAAGRFLAIIDAAHARHGRARVGEINRAVNLAIRPQSDPGRFGATDIWSTPLMTFAAGAGDCEDYAIAKYVALREAGMADEDLRLVILHDRRIDEDHAVVAARIEHKWLILDNRRMVLLTDTQIDDVTPLLALGSGEESPRNIAGQQPLAGVALASRN